MPKFIDITGQKFGRLTAKERVENNKHNQVQYLFICECGSEIIALKNPVVSGHTRSCGCISKEQIAAVGRLNTTHGMGDHFLYGTWIDMRNRCNNPNNAAYKNYGGRGIKVDPRWDVFETFISDVLPSYKDGTSLDRRDNNLGYGPDNFRWASRKEQALNRRSNHLIDTPAGRMTVTEAAERCGVSPRTLFTRLRRGCLEDKLFEGFSFK